MTFCFILIPVVLMILIGVSSWSVYKLISELLGIRND